MIKLYILPGFVGVVELIYIGCIVVFNAHKIESHYGVVGIGHPSLYEIPFKVLKD